MDLLEAAGGRDHVEGDDLFIEGGVPARTGDQSPATFEGRGDHRLAMAGAVLALASGGGAVLDADAIAISYPDFASDLSSLGARITRGRSNPGERASRSR